MNTVVIWGTIKDYAEYAGSFKYHEAIGDFRVLGITFDDPSFAFIAPYPFFNTESIKELVFDYLIICAGNQYLTVKSAANALGIDDKKILPAIAIRTPGFHLEKYMELKNSNISILSNNCWGGITYHGLGLEFRSPFINMFESESDYIKIVKNLKSTLEMPLKLYGTQHNDALDIEYPIYDLNGSKLYMNHYSDFTLAEEKWKQRKAKINYDNLFVMMYTSDIAFAEEFETLPYAKKVCFVPFETSLPSSYCLSTATDSEPFWSTVLKCASRVYDCYNIIDLLLYGK